MLGLKRLWAKFNPFDIDKHINSALSLIGQAKQESIDCKNEIIEVKRMIETIKNEYERYKHFSVALGDGMTDMLWLKDIEGRYIFANPSIIKNLL